MNPNQISRTRFLRSSLIKMSAFMLIFLLSLAPVLTVYAQEVAEEQQSSSEETSEQSNQSESTSEESETDSIESEETPIDEEKEGEEETPMSLLSSSYNQLSNPENLTAGLLHNVKGVLEPDDTTGALNFSLPITVPPGRNGMQPDLALTYNNQQASNTPNIIGYGWSVNIPYIERVNKTGTDKLYTSDYFYSSLSGELLNVSSGVYAPKVENGAFLKYSLASNVWTVTDKSGTVYKFGTNAAERQDNPSNSSQVYKWMLQEVRDTNNNYIKYEYYKDAGQIYPDTITYTGNASTDGIFEVEFTRESRSDVVTSYATAFGVTTNYRIDEILVKISGTWMRKYATSYTTGDAGGRSLLSAITESGRDDSLTTTTLPATSFTYYTATAGWTYTSSAYTAPTAFSDGRQSMIDLNSDAWPDIIESYTNGTSTIKNTYLNNTDGTWSTASGLQAPILFREFETRGGSYSDIWDQGVRLGDANGDLLPDMIKAEDNANSLGGFDAYLNTTGSSWTQDTGWNPTVTFNGDDNVNTWSSHYIDLNGDGITDIIRGANQEQINTGTAFGTAGTTWVPGFNLNGAYRQFVDVNADGLPDIMFNDGTTNTAYINNGNGTWTSDTSWAAPLSHVDGSGGDKGVRYFDVNNDGLPDAVPHYPYVNCCSGDTYLNTGYGWTAASSWDVPNDAAIDFTSNPVSITDLNADGAADFFHTQNGSPMTTRAWENNTHVPVDSLKRVTFPQGGYSESTYKKSSNYFDGSGNLLNPNLPIPFDTVSQIVTSDAFGGTSTDTYVYEGGLYYFNTYADRKPVGFATVTKTNSFGNKTITYFHQGNATNSSQGEYSDHISKAGKPYRIEVTDSSGNIYTKTVNKWDKHNIATGRDFVKLVRQTVLTYDGDGDHKDTAEEYDYDNTYGNLTEKIMWGEVTASDDGSYTDTGSDQATQTIAYTANTTDYIVGLPYQNTVEDQSSVLVSETKTYYDGQSLGTVTDGNPTKIERWKVSSTYVNTQKAYNTTYGIPTSSTDERGKTTTYSYDTYNLYPDTITDPLSYTTDYVYDYSLGKPNEVTDNNGFVYETIYDGLDRVIEEKIPGVSSPYTPVTKATYAYTDTSGAVSIHAVQYLDAGTAIDSYTYFDGLNRQLQSRTESETAYNVVDRVYNHELLHKESLPYSSSGSSRTSPTTTTALLAVYTYDPLNRISTIANAVGTTSYAYDQWVTTVTDTENNDKDYYRDAYGNLVQVDEHNSGIYSTYYTWDLNKNLTNITDANGNVRDFTYNALGHRLTADDLHASGDSWYGSWTYAYDNAGNLTQSVSPEANTINYVYDDLSRVIEENYTGATGKEIEYDYDSCTNGIGKLCTVTMLSGADTDYTYDSNGRINQDTKTIASNVYVTEYTYDRQNNLTLLKYPDNGEVQYTYNAAGSINAVDRKQSGGSFTAVISNIDYSPAGQMTVVSFTNGVATTNTYNASELYRLSNKTTLSGSTKLQDLDYDYDTVGNVIQIIDDSDTQGAKTSDYTYDDLYRLTEAAITDTANSANYTYNYDYDAIGNITSGPLGNYQYQGNSAANNYANPHAATDVGSITYTFNKDGNVTQDSTTTNAWQYDWNYKGQLEMVGFGLAGIDYWYDHEGTRVQRHKGSGDTFYPNKYYNEDPSGKLTKDIYVGSTLVATVETTGGTATPYYVHIDHLQGSNVISNGAGNEEQLLDYYPFGQVRLNIPAGGSPFNEEKQYGGHHYDADSTLLYLGARYYDGEISRFISEDPMYLAIGSEEKLKQVTSKRLEEILSDPQQLNSYTYARNNPLKYIDPTGNDYIEVNLSASLYPVSANVGFKIDFTNLRLDYTNGVGFGGGVSTDLSAMYNFGHLPKEQKYITTSTEVTAGAGIVGKGSIENTISLDQNNDIKNNSNIGGAIGVGVGGGMSIAVTTNSSHTLIDYSRQMNSIVSAGNTIGSYINGLIPNVNNLLNRIGGIMSNNNKKDGK